jgi:hypothetical protein
MVPRPVSVEAHYLADILKELHRLRLAVERLERKERQAMLQNEPAQEEEE